MEKEENVDFSTHDKQKIHHVNIRTNSIVLLYVCKNGISTTNFSSLCNLFASCSKTRIKGKFLEGEKQRRRNRRAKSNRVLSNGFNRKQQKELEGKLKKYPNYEIRGKKEVEISM